MVDNGRQRQTMVDNGRQWQAMVNNCRQLVDNGGDNASASILSTNVYHLQHQVLDSPAVKASKKMQHLGQHRACDFSKL